MVHCTSCLKVDGLVRFPSLGGTVTSIAPGVGIELTAHEVEGCGFPECQPAGHIDDLEFAETGQMSLTLAESESGTMTGATQDYEVHNFRSHTNPHCEDEVPPTIFQKYDWVMVPK